jgi:hypothetical protein
MIAATILLLASQDAAGLIDGALETVQAPSETKGP